MDRYGDVNILARTLHDITSGIAEVQKQIDETFGQFGEDAGALSVMVSALQGEVTRARMVPVDQLFLLLRLPVRDAAYRAGKSVRVASFGEQVDLDKTIIDKLYVPMLHLVRNCVAHGIEETERRRLTGKDPVGTITVSAHQAASQIVIEVSDDGAGLGLALPLGFAERILDVADQGVHESAGVRRIQVEGTYLALKSLDTLLELPARTDPPPPGSKALVLEAGEQRVERFLRTLGTEVVLAIDGQDALDRLAGGGIDLVFTDLEMPRMHGYELIRRIREHPAMEAIPVVVVTSRSGQKHREQAQTVGAQDYPTKPFTQDVLQQMLGKWGGREEQ